MAMYKNYIYEYYNRISSGEITVGKWIKAVYKIIVDGLEKQEYFFNQKEGLIPRSLLRNKPMTSEASLGLIPRSLLRGVSLQRQQIKQ